MQHRTLYAEGNFYSGNLHTHSTLSDGKASPEEIVRYYRDVMGLDFLSITDHELFKRHHGLGSEDFLLIPGVELNTIPTPQDRADHHVVGISVEDACDLPDEFRFDDDFARSHDCQGLIDTLNGHGLIPIFCHPFWSRTTLEEGKNLKNVCGMEILNFACEGLCHDGRSDVFYDAALLAGNPMWCFASDDAHHLGPDCCGGHITVRCASLTNRDITQAIRDGSFYASSGPEIYDFYVEDGEVHLSCSPAKDVILIGWRPFGSEHARDGIPVTRVDCKLPPFEGWRVWDDTPGPFVRAAVVDDKGRMAWTQPIYY